MQILTCGDTGCPTLLPDDSHQDSPFNISIHKHQAYSTFSPVVSSISKHFLTSARSFKGPTPTSHHLADRNCPDDNKVTYRARRRSTDSIRRSQASEARIPQSRTRLLQNILVHTFQATLGLPCSSIQPATKGPSLTRARADLLEMQCMRQKATLLAHAHATRRKRSKKDEMQDC